jgi:aspartyl-tRNA(Asn)/glutamyl-tRNA(Gln) amidotransferase subunit A
MTVSEAATMFRAGDLTSVDLTTALIERADALDPKTGTYVVRFDEYALAKAEQADKDFADGVDKGPYQGVPIGMKDILAVAHGPTTANSLVLDPAWGHQKHGPVVNRLKAGGAVITGKLTTSEFAIGDPDPTKPFALPFNPWDLERSPGGSSAGTGNGLAAGLFLAGIGTDTGGSIRIPAAWNGITGLMPTYGRVPKSGCAPLGYTLDHIGPMARSARDCAAMLGIIAGYHSSDECCIDRPVDDYLGQLTGDLTGVRIGVERAHHFPADADPALAGRFDAALAALESLGAQLIEITLPYYEEVNAALWVMMAAEAMAYHRQDLQQRWGEFYAHTRTTLALGALASAADYVQAARVRRLAQRELVEVFDTVDLVAGPTSSIGAPKSVELSGQGAGDIWRYACFTEYWDAVGNPALALPMGFNDSGLPLSLQLAARPFEEGVALRAGDAYQQVTDWHLQVPPVVAQLLDAA